MCAPMYSRVPNLDFGPESKFSDLESLQRKRIRISSSEKKTSNKETIKASSWASLIDSLFEPHMGSARIVADY